MKTVSTPKITKRPRTAPVKVEKTPQDVAIETFIDAAPDSVKVVEAIPKPLPKDSGRKQISHTMPPALLEKIDERASRMGLTRASFINYVLSDFVNK
jgi:hypothetical protein